MHTYPEKLPDIISSTSGNIHMKRIPGIDGVTVQPSLERLEQLKMPDKKYKQRKKRNKMSRQSRKQNRK